MLKIEEERQKADVIIEIFKDEIRIDPFKDPKNRNRSLVDMRALLMYLMRKHTNLSLDEIGKYWKTDKYRGKDHASVSHNVRKAQDLLSNTFGEINFITSYTKCSTRIKNAFPAMEFTKRTLAEELLYVKKLNHRLIQREIQRKEDFIIFAKGLKYIPLKYKKYIKRYLDICQIPL